MKFLSFFQYKAVIALIGGLNIFLVARYISHQSAFQTQEIQKTKWMMSKTAKTDLFYETQKYLKKVEKEYQKIVKIKRKLKETLVEKKYRIKEKKVEYLVRKQPQSQDILEKVPMDTPAWVQTVPLDPENYYFVGMSYGQPSYEAGMEAAKQDALVELAKFIQYGVDSYTEKLTIETPSDIMEKMSQKISALSKNNFMRESRVEERFYIKKSKNQETPSNHYQFFVLTAFPKKNVEKALQEGIAYQAELLKTILSAEQLEKLKQKLDLLNNQLYLEKETVEALQKEKNLFYQVYQMNNLYQIAQFAEKLEREGELLEAYRNEAVVVKRLQKLIENLENQ
ncbi:MAG TPA: hypothetical protein DHW82_11550 [Spirochaetia bacterium]|nr:MAG: hypothetical protein A2Y41_01630 [Spirochaetes bacterium GWB1_36_13]HCL57627.1 hypothetical protein [Spirochaetia bacterium]